MHRDPQVRGTKKARVVLRLEPQAAHAHPAPLLLRLHRLDLGHHLFAHRPTTCDYNKHLRERDGRGPTCRLVEHERVEEDVEPLVRRPGRARDEQRGPVIAQQRERAVSGALYGQHGQVVRPVERGRGHVCEWRRFRRGKVGEEVVQSELLGVVVVNAHEKLGNGQLWKAMHE